MSGSEPSAWNPHASLVQRVTLELIAEECYQQMALAPYGCDRCSGLGGFPRVSERDQARVQPVPHLC